MILGGLAALRLGYLISAISDLSFLNVISISSKLVSELTKIGYCNFISLQLILAFESTYSISDLVFKIPKILSFFPEYTTILEKHY